MAGYTDYNSYNFLFNDKYILEITPWLYMEIFVFFFFFLYPLHRKYMSVSVPDSLPSRVYCSDWGFASLIYEMLLKCINLNWFLL